jgi:hypothetical protein
MLLLAEASATVDERQESILIIDDRRVPLQLDELPQCIAVKRWAKLLVDKLDKLSPLWHPMIAFNKGVPMGCVVGHVEGHQEHFVGFLYFLDAE